MKFNRMDVQSLDGFDAAVDYEDAVDECPVCRVKIQPTRCGGRRTYGQEPFDKMWVVYQCPRLTCQSVFLAQFHCFNTKKSLFSFFTAFPVNQGQENFPDEITGISKEFSEIYNQALHSEELGLNHICGPGYRKSLEFLVKDFSVHKNPGDKQKIENSLLGSCIQTFISDSRIKAMAERAAWLGNDETHYIRKWENHDLQDLKNLIQLTVNFIHSEILSDSYSATMERNNPVPQTNP